MSKLDNYQIIAKTFSDQHDIIHFRGDFYLFNEGIWRLEDKENTIAWINKEYRMKNSAPLETKGLKEIINMIQTETYEKYRKKIKYLDTKRSKNHINTNTGILDLDTLITKPYEKDDFCFHKLPFDYIPDPKCPIMMKFLSTSMGFGWPLDDNIDLDDYKKTMTFIQEWIGYTMMTGNPLERALIMTGVGRNGKGTLIHIWQHILGDYNVSTLGMASLNNPQQIHLTRNKLVNLSKDSEPGAQLDTEMIKKAVAGEEVNANPKYVAPYDFIFTAKIVMACNDMPFTKSTDPNVRERFYVLPFNEQFAEDKRDKQLKQKLETEAQQIFSWAVNGIKTLKERGYFDPPERCKARLMEFLTANNSVMMWIEDGCMADPLRRCKRADAWRDYKIYCDDAKLKPYSKGKFFEKLSKAGYKPRLLDGEYWINGIRPPANSEYEKDSSSYIKAVYDKLS